ncbi:MAG: hypothetical protein SFY68_11210 [Candidatus Sumerlaeia bacterium]|nr:hypothetical protein [Candidatus Sumerlaeia bacterium]
MRTELRAKVQTTRWAAFAELAWMERRPEIGILCQRAAKEAGVVSPSLIQQVVPGLPSAGALNIIAQLKMLGLCDGHGALTPLGREAAKDHEVPIPEQGTYELWIGEHPVFGCRLVHVDRIEAKGDDRRGYDPVRIPPVPDRSIATPSALDPKEKVVFRDFPRANGNPVGIRRNDSSNLEVRWELDSETETSRWSLVGILDIPGKGPRQAIPVQIDLEVNLELLTDHWGHETLRQEGQWDPKMRRLRIRAEQASEAEKRSFRKAFGPREIDVPGVATFKGATLSDVAIAPANQQESQAWATAMLHSALAKEQQYRTRQQVRSLFAQQIDGTPLEEFETVLKPHEELISEFDSQPELFWELAAPVDLSPFLAASDDLQALRIGGKSTPPITQFSSRTPGGETVSVSLGSRLTMRELVGRLFAQARPRKLLLCDRHVRGERSLILLQVFVQEVSEVNPTCQFHIWTDSPSVDDIAAINKYIGQPPKSYQEVFGKNRPHDRYLLAVDHQGAKHAWQMTNSLLHPSWARAAISVPDGNTPLRWNDMLAVKLPITSISPDIARWFGEGK